MIISVSPISNKAKNRFHNLMESNSNVLVEQETSNSVFVASMNGKYFFWIEKVNDLNWKIKV